MKAWITSYALTKGIFEAEGDVDDKMFTTKMNDYPAHFHGRDWHRTEDAAKARAREMVETKLASIEKLKTKLEKLKEKYA